MKRISLDWWACRPICVDTTELEQMTHEVRVSSTDDGAFQWQAGVFYSNIKRNYSQRVPTPMGTTAIWGEPLPVAHTQWISVKIHRTTPI